jgi:hypothetical protein
MTESLVVENENYNNLNFEINTYKRVWKIYADMIGSEQKISLYE